MGGDNGNPFATPLGSEVQDHQQAQAATVQASSNGNPFAEPLMSEKAEGQPSADNMTNWSADQPLTSYGAATRGAIGGLIDHTLDAVKGAASFINPKPQSDNENVALSTAGVGGMLVYRMMKSLGDTGHTLAQPHDIAAAIHDINQSSDPIGTYAKIAQKTASQGAGQAITALATDSVLKGGPAAAKGAGRLAKDVMQGEKAAQLPAESALRTGAEASATDAGVTATKDGGLRTLLDKPIKELAGNERTTYDTLNKASGTDLKSLYDYSSDLQDALDDPTNIAQKAKLQKELQTTQDAITKGEATATANGVDPKTLSTAKAMTQQRYAMEAAKQKLFNNESVVTGNASHGVPENINVKSAIRQVENLDKPSRYAPEGSPTRLVQAFGEDGAKALKQGLYDAQKEGVSALKKQTVAKWLSGALGVGVAGEAIKKAF